VAQSGHANVISVEEIKMELLEKKEKINNIFTRPYSRMDTSQWRQIFHILTQGSASKMGGQERHETRKEFKLWKSRYNDSHCWKEKRKEILSDNALCKCGKMANVVHHLSYARMGRESLDDLKIVCKDCHYDYHKLEISYWQDDEEFWEEYENSLDNG
jgi:hypothetical protein